MKKALVGGALSLVLLGGAAVPVQSAFGSAGSRQAARCGMLIEAINQLQTQYLAAVAAHDTDSAGAIALAGDKLVAKANRLGCAIP